MRPPTRISSLQQGAGYGQNNVGTLPWSPRLHDVTLGSQADTGSPGSEVPSSGRLSDLELPATQAISEHTESDLSDWEVHASGDDGMGDSDNYADERTFLGRLQRLRETILELCDELGSLIATTKRTKGS